MKRLMGIEFLQNFLDHQHLNGEITDYDFKCLFHGSDGVCVCVHARVHYFHACAHVFVKPCIQGSTLTGKHTSNY